MKVVITAGGTGGHIVPALTVADALRRVAPEEVTFAFLGPEDRGERRMVASSGIDFHPVPAAAIRGKGAVARGKGVMRLGSGTLGAVRLLRSLKPDVVFSTGGYASFPACVAARVLRKPLVVFLPDVRPGWAVRAESRLATRMATTTAAALAHLPAAKTIVTGYPVREAFHESRAEARRTLGIGGDEHVLLVAGASQGAQAINAAIFAGLHPLLERAHVFHVTGEADLPVAEEQRAQLPAAMAQRYHPAAYRDDLPRVMIAADLAIMRSGASTLGELPAAKLPAILVPGTFAGGHQADNARWLQDAGAARITMERDIDQLAAETLALLDDHATLDVMKTNAGRVARPDAAEAIAQLIVETAR